MIQMGTYNPVGVFFVLDTVVIFLDVELHVLVFHGIEVVDEFVFELDDFVSGSALDVEAFVVPFYNCIDNLHFWCLVLDYFVRCLKS